MYDISKTLEILPYLSWGLLAVVLAVLEFKNFREQLSDGPTAEPGRGGFIPPPGDGYEYYVSASTIVYILKKYGAYRVYVVQGDNPNAKLKHDRYGTFFCARGADTGTIEKIVDAAYRR